MHFRRGGELLFSFSCLGGGGILEKLCLTLVTPWTVACQAALSMGFSRQEYLSELPFSSPKHIKIHIEILQFY